MEQIINKKEELKAILAANDNLPEQISGWSISYNKRVDMLVAGKDFPVGSFYFPVDEGVMLRIDKDRKIYGFAIENTKFFMRENPQLALPLSILVYPYRFWFYILPTLFVSHHIAKGLNKMKSITTISDYIAGRAAFC